MTKIEWIENKTPDWKVASVSDGGKVYQDVSVNRVNKKGETFPGFDDLKPGTELTDVTVWTSTSNKHYLFTQTKPTPGVMGSKPAWAGGGGVKAAQERKAQDIEKAQDRKEESIAYFNAMNCSINLVKGNLPMESDEDMTTIEANIDHWFKFFYRRWYNFKVEDIIDPTM